MIDSSITVLQLQEAAKNTLMEHLGMVYTEVGADYVCATMPVDKRTFQPFGLLHGGASAALAETLGSVGSNLMLDADWVSVGVEINCNHLKSVRSGVVKGKATPIHLGKQLHVWEIRIWNEKDELICISRMTNAIIKKR